MAIVVGTDTYVTTTELETYATKRGITLSGSPTSEILLIKAMDYIETRPYKGVKYDSDQDLQFPRSPDSTVPDNIEIAQMVAAILIDTGVDLFETIERAVKRRKIDGATETEYMDNAAEKALYPQLNALLRPYLSSGPGGFNVQRG